MNSYQTEYLQIWNEAFAQFLGWSKEETLSWAQPKLESLALPGMDLNEPPLYWVAKAIVFRQPYFEKLDGAAMDILIRKIERAMADGKRNFPPGIDFTGAKIKVNRLLVKGAPK